MCLTLTSMTLAQGLGLAGSAISAIGAISQGQQAKAMGNYQAEQAAADAEAARGQAQVEAAKIRKAGERQRSSAIASMAAAGVDSNVGTADIINKEITAGYEEDAVLAVFGGDTSSRRLIAQGRASKIRGDNAGIAGFLDAGSSALKAGSAFGKGWRSTVRLTDGSYFASAMNPGTSALRAGAIGPGWSAVYRGE
ncbi:MAG: hypothetical protein KIT63_13395 [Rhodoferax sp.]|nr:hypothetical protein [Rhodoferax sp.]